MTLKDFHFFKLVQPVGNFYAIKINAADLIPIAESKQRKPYNNSSGVQRKLDNQRINHIADYSKTQNAMFPTPIILSANSSYVDISFSSNTLSIKDNYIKENREYFSIVDGQHRLAGMERAETSERFELLALLTFDTTLEEDADIFIAINKNQKPVTKSLVYDLFGLSSTRSVEKFLHEISVAINESNKSSMKNHIKMLGYKTDELLSPNITQGALVDIMRPLFSNNTNEDNQNLSSGFSLDENSKIPLRYLLIKNDVDNAAKIVMLFLNSWMNMVNLLNYQKTKFVKTVGYNLAFHMLLKFLNENPNYFKNNNQIIDGVYDQTLWTEIMNSLRTQKMTPKIASINKSNIFYLEEPIDEDEFNLLSWLLYQLITSRKFNKDTVNNFSSSLSGVHEMFKIITEKGL